MPPRPVHPLLLSWLTLPFAAAVTLALSPARTRASEIGGRGTGTRPAARAPRPDPGTALSVYYLDIVSADADVPARI